MRIFGFLDQKRSKTIQILSQIFDCYGVIKGSVPSGTISSTPSGSPYLRPHAIINLN